MESNKMQLEIMSAGFLSRKPFLTESGECSDPEKARMIFAPSTIKTLKLL